MIASGNKGWFPCSNQCAKYFLEEICGFSGHVSDRQAFAGGGKSRPGGGRRNVDRATLRGGFVGSDGPTPGNPDTYYPGTVWPSQPPVPSGHHSDRG